MEEHKSKEDYLRAEYWNMSGAKKGIAEFLGSTVVDWNFWQDSDISSEYLGVSNRPKLYRDDKISPVTLIEPHEFKYKYHEFMGQLELNNSLWQKESKSNPDYPNRVLLFWDLELYDMINPLSPIENQYDTFDKLSNINNLMKNEFNNYGIDYQAIMSGRGYNYLTQIDGESSVIDQLLDISGVPERTVLGKQSHPNPSFKRNKPIPINAELLHMASVRLQQYLYSRIIREARRCQNLPVEVSDKGDYGIALDNTSMMYSVENRMMGTLGTPYFIKIEKSDPSYSQTVVKVPIKGIDFDFYYQEMLDIRNNYQKSNDLLGDVDCKIPDGSKGISKLIEDYKSSELYKLHKAMDNSFGDKHDRYEYGYRRYIEIANKTSNPESIYRLIINANDELLKPDNLDYFIWEIYKSWGGNDNNLEIAGHVAGLLRAIYEDPEFNWGNRFLKNDAQRFARGWVMTLLGQKFELS